MDDFFVYSMRDLRIYKESYFSLSIFKNTCYFQIWKVLKLDSFYLENVFFVISKVYKILLELGSLWGKLRIRIRRLSEGGDLESIFKFRPSPSCESPLVKISPNLVQC